MPSIDLTFDGLRQWQKDIWEGFKRHNVLVVHRRAGKTVLAIIWLIWRVAPIKNGRGAYIAPQYNQAKRVAWDYLKRYAGAIPGTIFNEAELKATFPNGAVIYLLGAESYLNLKGIGLDAAVLDEVAQMPSVVWSEVVRPALADRIGHSLFIGTPRGMADLFYELFSRASTLPDWYGRLLTWKDTGCLPDSEIAALKTEMSQEAFEQEMECSWTAAIKGAYWGREMAEAEKAGRICAVPHELTARVITSFDLGMSDSTAVWYWQLVGKEVHAIRYEEYQNTGLPEIFKQMRSYPYDYEMHIAPFDINVRELGSGRSRKEIAFSLGVNFTLAPNWRVNEGIEAFRTLIPRIWFDREHCGQGVEALKLYRSEFKSKNEVFSKAPLHDWTSHAADSARYFATTFDERVIGQQHRPLKVNYAGTI